MFKDAKYDAIKKYLVKNYGYDSGHGQLAVLITAVFIAFGMGPFWAGLIGGNIYAIPKEIIDIKRYAVGNRRIHIDNISDYTSYQLSWPLAYGADQQPFVAILMLVIIAAIYLPLVYWKLKPKE